MAQQPNPIPVDKIGSCPRCGSVDVDAPITGDYLDARIKNTPEELAAYDERLRASGRP
jgi:hypothetical protein